MAKVTRTTIKSAFENGDRPTQSDFENLIDSSLNANDDGIEKQVGSDQPIKITSHGAEKNTLDLYSNTDFNWRINQNPVVPASNPSMNNAGFNIENNGDSRFFIEQSSGNIGVNTPTPHAQLHINQANNGDDVIRVDNQGNNTTAVVVQNDGSVGIGTDLTHNGSTLTIAGHTQADDLTVKNTMMVEQDVTILGNLNVTGTTTQSQIDLHLGNVMLGSVDTDRITVEGYLDSGHTSGAVEIHDALHVEENIVVDQRVGIATATPQNALDVAGSATIGRTYAGTEGAPNDGLLVEGTVAIGTDTPTAKLHVNKSGTGDALRIDDQANSITSFIVKNNAKVGIATANPVIALAIGDDDTGLNSPASDELAIVTNNVERVRVDSSGHVGIGTATPKNTLDVAGGLAVGSSLAGVTSAPSNGLLVEGPVGIGATAPSIALAIGDDDTGLHSPASDELAIVTNNVEQVRVDSSGHMGVGTATPKSKLAVAG
ncbi:MAG: hypothetical protein JKY13_03145, partial [Gammaproteobacteria bacterium]|nr:hypothetical protein [Gammaproteobacteria bacterium]